MDKDPGIVAFISCTNYTVLAWDCVAI